MDRSARDLAAARAAMLQARPEKAVRLLRQVLQTHPRDPEVLSFLAVSLFESGDRLAALDAGRRAVAVGPGSARAHYNLAVLLHRGGDAATAIVHLDKALELAPHHPAARVEKAQALAGLGRHAEAVEILGEHVNQFTQDEDAHRDLAIFAERAGKWREAAEAWAHVATHGPDCDEATVRLVAVRAELDGPAAAKAHAVDAGVTTPALRHRLDKALAHAGRGVLSLKPLLPDRSG